MGKSLAYEIAVASNDMALTILEALDAGVSVARVHQDRYVAAKEQDLAALERKAGLHRDSTEPDSQLAITRPL